MIIKLTKEYDLGSKKYKEIDLKLDNLTGLKRHQALNTGI